jgi:hypothetical protein
MGGTLLAGAAAVKDGAAEPPGVAAATACPHDGQNFDSGGSGLPQLGQNIFFAPQIWIQTEEYSEKRMATNR